MRKELPAGMVLGTISHGTLRPADLIPKFLDVLRVVNAPETAKIEDRYADIIKAGYSADSLPPEEAAVFETDMAAMLEEVWETIDSNMPEGYWFGCVEGDGSDFAIQEIPFEDAADGR